MCIYVNPHSTSKCNSHRSDFIWCFKPKTFHWAIVYQPLYPGNLHICDFTKVSPIPPDKSVDVFIRPSLP